MYENGKIIHFLKCKDSYGCGEISSRILKIGALYVLSPLTNIFNPYPTAFPYGNGMVLHFYQQQESSTTKTVHKVINKGFKTYV